MENEKQIKFLLSELIEAEFDNQQADSDKEISYSLMRIEAINKELDYLGYIEKNKGGAPMENTNARKDPSKKLSKQITIYTTEKSINNWIALAEQAGLTTSKFVNHVMNKKRLPKEKSNPLIDNIL